MEQGIMDLRSACSREATPIRAIDGFHRVSLGIQIFCNFQQHSRKPNIVSGLSQLPRACGSLPEVVSVQTNLLFCSQDSDQPRCTAITTQPAFGTSSNRHEDFAHTDGQDGRFAALSVLGEGQYRVSGT
jgi:hypothetical protein